MKTIRMYKYIIATLILLSLVLTTGSFAYWATNIEGTSVEASNTLQIGSGNTVQTVISINESSDSVYGELVPLAQLENSSSKAVSEMYFNFDMKWHEDNLVSQVEGTDIYGYLETSISFDITTKAGVLLDKEVYQNIYHLITITPSENNNHIFKLNSDTANSINYTVQMEEPENKTAYDLIHNSVINIFFDFIIDIEKANSYGNNMIEVVRYIETLINEYYEANGSYPRSWGDYAYTDIGLDPEEFESAIYHFEFVPRGERIDLRLEEGYSISVYQFDGTLVTFDSDYNWNLNYSIETQEWYYHGVDDDNLIDISTLVVS